MPHTIPDFEVIADVQNRSLTIGGLFKRGEARRLDPYIIGRDADGQLWVARGAEWCVPVYPREVATIRDVVAEGEARASAGAAASAKRRPDEEKE